MSDLSTYAATEILRDGSTIAIRAIRPDDKERLLAHFLHLSPQSVYYRFMGIKRSLGEDDLRRLTELDFQEHVGLAATLGSGADERFIGVGRYFRNGPNHAEVAFAVLDDHQGRGIGTLLLHHLVRIATSQSIQMFSALVMGSNAQMLEVFADSGFHLHDSHDAGMVRVRLDLGDSSGKAHGIPWLDDPATRRKT